MISAQTRAQVRERAQNVCEYCQLHQDDSPLAALHVEHIIPKIHGGSDDLDNAALACIDCNLHKGTNLTGIDPDGTVPSQTPSLGRPFRLARDLYSWQDANWPDQHPGPPHEFGGPTRTPFIMTPGDKAKLVGFGDEASAGVNQ